MTKYQRRNDRPTVSRFCGYNGLNRPPSEPSADSAIESNAFTQYSCALRSLSPPRPSPRKPTTIPPSKPLAIVDREYNFAAASAGNAGTSLLFQWREGVNTDWQFSLDGGLASPKGGGNTRIILGGGLGYP